MHTKEYGRLYDENASKCAERTGPNALAQFFSRMKNIYGSYTVVLSIKCVTSQDEIVLNMIK